MGTRVFVKGTPPHADRRELMNIFKQYGWVQEITTGAKDFIFVVRPFRACPRNLLACDWLLRKGTVWLCTFPRAIVHQPIRQLHSPRQSDASLRAVDKRAREKERGASATFRHPGVRACVRAYMRARATACLRARATGVRGLGVHLAGL